MDRQHDSTYAEAENLKKEFDSLKQDLQSLRGDMSDMFRSVINLGKSGSADARDRMSEEMEHRLNQMKGAAGEARHRGERAFHAFEHKVEEHPLSSIVIAFGIGLLAGLVAHRK